MMKRALLVVDVQKDFCEGGALAASDTGSLIKPLQCTIEASRLRKCVIVFTQDWHPQNHNSFEVNGGKWPIHCVAGSYGAELTPPLKVLLGELIVRKGETRESDGYSAFESNGLSEQLHSLGVKSVAVSGIATEYCVRATALDAIKAGFHVALLIDLIRPVDSKLTSGVLSELSAAGIKLLDSNTWLHNLKS